jgi:Flp pilus assembly protein TadB
MNKFYLIIPAVLLVVFSGIYINYMGQAAEKEAAAQRAAEIKAAEEQARREEGERQARLDAERRAAERALEEQRREEERVARFQAGVKALEDEAAGFAAEAAKQQAEIESITATLDALRNERAAALASNLAFELEVERARIAKRNAELEVQRLVEMVARRAGTSLSPR